MKKLLAFIFLGLSLNVYSQSILNGYRNLFPINLGMWMDDGEFNGVLSADFNLFSKEYLGDLGLGVELRTYMLDDSLNNNGSERIVELGGRLVYGYYFGTGTFGIYPYGGLTLGYLFGDNGRGINTTAILGTRLNIWKGWGGYAEYVFNLLGHKSYLTVGLSFIPLFDRGSSRRLEPKPAPPPTPPPVLPSVSIINKTGYTIYYLRISQSTADKWGEDILDEDVLKNGGYVDAKLSSPLNAADRYDIQLIDEDGDTYTKWNILISNNAQITFTISDLDYNEPPVPPPVEQAQAGTVFYQYDGTGYVYLTDNVFYLCTNGRPVGYREGDTIYAFSGKVLGFYANAFIYDMRGNPVGADDPKKLGTDAAGKKQVSKSPQQDVPAKSPKQPIDKPRLKNGYFGGLLNNVF